MSDLNSGTVGGFGHMGESDPYGNGSSGSTSSGNGGGNNNKVDNSTVTIKSTKSYSGVYMAMCVNNLKNHEGYKNRMYKDDKGNITVGIGHKLSTPEMAAALPFTRTHSFHAHGDDITKEVGVSDGEIMGAWNAYKNDSKAVPNMHLTDEAIVNTCISDVETAQKGLRGLYSGYDSFPEHAKVALVDMAFNLGITTLSKKFTKFNAAVNNKDWKAAAAESHRDLNQNGDARNKDTAAQLLQAAQG